MVTLSEAHQLRYFNYMLEESTYLSSSNSNNTCMVFTRVFKEGEGECRTAYILRVTAVRTVHDLCNDIHVWRSP